jgi:transcription initiation factor IIE alpha subunit
MLSTTDILTIIEEQETINIKELTKKLQIPQEQVEKILKDLNKHNLVDYDTQTGETKLSQWLVNLNKTIENIKPSIATIILPKNQEIKIEDLTIGNFIGTDLELNLKIKGKQKEIAICKIT